MNTDNASSQNESTNSNNGKLQSIVPPIAGCVAVVSVAAAVVACTYIVATHKNCEAFASFGGKESLFSFGIKSNDTQGSEEKVSSQFLYIITLLLILNVIFYILCCYK